MATIEYKSLDGNDASISIMWRGGVEWMNLPSSLFGVIVNFLPIHDKLITVERICRQWYKESIAGKHTHAIHIFLWKSAYSLVGVIGWLTFSVV
jgi:hypothetical protein